MPFPSQLCQQCGARIPRYAVDYLSRSGDRTSRAGKRRGGDLAQIDPSGKFCTLRCAAEWAVAHAPEAKDEPKIKPPRPAPVADPISDRRVDYVRRIAEQRRRRKEVLATLGLLKGRR